MSSSGSVAVTVFENTLSSVAVKSPIGLRTGALLTDWLSQTQPEVQVSMVCGSLLSQSASVSHADALHELSQVWTIDVVPVVHEAVALSAEAFSRGYKNDVTFFTFGKIFADGATAIEST